MKTTNKLTVYQIERALAKDRDVKGLLDELKKRINLFKDHPRDIQVQYGLHVILEVTSLNDWNEEVKYTKDLQLGATDTFKCDIYLIEHIRKLLLHQMAIWVYSSLGEMFDDLKGEKILSVEAKDDGYPWFSLDTIAWSDDQVGIWYVEQECGEGWIILPKEPKIKRSSYTVDNIY